MKKKIISIVISLAVSIPFVPASFAKNEMEIDIETATTADSIATSEVMEDNYIIPDENIEITLYGEVELMATATYYSDYGVYFDTATGTITDVDETATKFNIPERIDGIDVVRIGSNAFADCVLTTEIILSDKIERIESNAFKNCTALTNVHLPEKLNYLGYRTFENCVSLTEITIPPLVNTTTTSSNKGQWIYGCTSLQSVTLTSGMTIVPEQAFRDCTYFTNITIPDL